MKLYEFGPTRSARARWALQALGLELESLVVNGARGEHKRPEFLALNPAGKQLRAKTFQWMLFAATELEQPLWRIARHSALYPEQERIPAEISVAERDFRDMVQVLEAHLEQRLQVVGQFFTTADIITAYTLDWANEILLLDGFKNCTAYLECQYQRRDAPPRIATALRSVGLAQN